MNFFENLCISYSQNSNIYGYNIDKLLFDTTLYIVPMLNPDGVNLVNGNLNVNSKEYSNAKYISSKYPNIPFPDGWKANINGVDLEILQPVYAYLSSKENFSLQSNFLRI